MNTTTDQPSPGRLLALVMIGCGFLAIGIMYYLLSINNSKTEYASFTDSTADFSTVPAKVDFVAPELNLTTLAGDPVSLADYRGSVVLVNLWATWCPPCAEEMPTLQVFYEQYRSKGFVLIAVDQGETTVEVAPFALEYGLTFPIWLDPQSEAGRVFNTMNLPSSYVVDRNGNVRLMWIGGISAANLEKYVPTIILE